MPTTRFDLLALLLASIATTASVSAEAGFPPPGGWKPTNGLNAGASLAWVGGGELENAFAPGLDVAYVRRVRAPLFFWASLGLELWTDGEDLGAKPHVETGLSFLFFVLGAGYGPGLGSDAMPKHAVSAFAAIAVPVWTPRHGRIFYIEPYYRPTWDVSPKASTVFHEVGALFKWFFQIGE